MTVTLVFCVTEGWGWQGVESHYVYSESYARGTPTTKAVLIEVQERKENGFFKFMFNSCGGMDDMEMSSQHLEILTWGQKG